MNALPQDRPATPSLLDGMGLLADATRSRVLAVLEAAELTVAELCEVVALPQSTVSRHLKALGDAGWVAARRDGTSRIYSPTLDAQSTAARRLWELVREDVGASRAADHDRRRLEQVLERRRLGSNAFFSRAAADWDELRAELFGATSDLRLLPALLDPDAVVGDLGCGSGTLAATLAPFVARVVAVDRSPEMLEVARARLARHANVQVAVGAIEALPLADASLDVALVVHVLHHVPETVRALAEARRVLRPGGRLVVADVLPHDDEEFRRTLGHVWLGFDRERIEAAFVAAGLVAERWHELAVDRGARGPGLFVATARVPDRPRPIAP